MEGKAIHAVLDGRAVPVNSIKGALGHTLGAAGVFEALMCVRSIEDGIVAPTAGLHERDPAIELDVVTSPRRSELRVALSTSSGFGGTNCALVLERA